MTRSRDPRDRITDQIQLLVDSAADDPGLRKRLDHAWFSDDVGPELPGGWPPPTELNRDRGEKCVGDAGSAALRSMGKLGVQRPELMVASLRRVELRGKPMPLPAGFCPTPLLATVVEPAAFRHLQTVAGYIYARPMLPGTREPLFADDIRLHLHRRLNAFALLESQLWWYAKLGGYPDPPPYNVRYEVARWLWIPRIAGTVICLRCGMTHISARHERRDTPRTPRCRICARGKKVAWPPNALEPHTRGTWILHCAAPGCSASFAGRRQARYCEQHRLNRITGSRRASRGLSDAMV